MEAPPEVVVNESFITLQPRPALDPTSKALPRFDNIIEEPAWNPARILGREQLVAKTTWDTSNFASDFLDLDMNIPYNLLSNIATKELMQTFTYYRCDFVVTITVTGTKFHCGLLNAAFLPLTYARPNYDELPRGFILEHALIEANGVNTGVIRIPYRSPRSYLSTFDNPVNFTLGNLYLQVISPLQAATGSANSIPVSITWHAENIEFYVPSMTPTNVLPPTFNLATTFKTLRTREVVGQPHSDVPLPVVVDADTVKTETVNGPVKACSSTRAHDSPQSVRDILKRMTPIGQGQLFDPFPLIGDTSTSSGMSSWMIGFMDAASILDQNVSMHPASRWANSYALAKGSLRYTFVADIANSAGGPTGDVQVPQITSFGVVFLPGYIPIMPFNRSDDNNLGLINPPGSSVDPFVNQYNFQAMMDAFNFIPRDGTFYGLGTTEGNAAQFYSNGTSGAAVVMADSSHNSVSIDIPFVCRDNAYIVNDNIPANDTVTGSAVNYNGAQFPDNTKFVGAVTCGQVNMNTYLSTVSRLRTPGTIFIFAQVNQNSQFSSSVYQQRKVNIKVFGAIGDDFRFGVLRNLPYGPNLCYNPRSLASTSTAFVNPSGVPYAQIPQFGAWGLQPDGWPARLGTVDGKPHGNTITTVNKFKHIANSTLPINITGDKFDVDATIPTMGMDKPTNTLGGLAMMPSLTSPMPNGVGIFNGVKMSLHPDQVDTASPELFGTDQDEMDLCYLSTILTPVSNACTSFGACDPWNTSDAEGTMLFSIPLSPAAYADPTVSTANSYSTTMLEQVSSQFLYWNGSIRFRFKVMATQFHTGRLFLAVSYYPFRDYDLAASFDNTFTTTSRYPAAPPQSISEALVQGGVFLDLSTDTREVTIDVPYKSMYPRLNIPNGFQPDQVSIMGKLTCWVVNELVAPENVAPSVDFITLAGAGPDFSMYTLSPYAAMLDKPRQNPIKVGITQPVVAST